MRNIAIFASGSGTNAENIIAYFSTRNSAKVVLVLSNNRDAFVLKRAAKHKIKSVFFERNDFNNTGFVSDLLTSNKIDFIVLAGFLWLIPEAILDKYQGKIVNIHPALLPKYGGKGMYGDRVHQAVINNHEKESGISIHFVNKRYDEGELIFQAKCKVEPDDTPDTLAKKVHSLEYEHFPVVIENTILKIFK
jgi:phosphoribosylglycinamide formyltransferase 1